MASLHLQFEDLGRVKITWEEAIDMEHMIERGGLR